MMNRQIRNIRVAGEPRIAAGIGGVPGWICPRRPVESAAGVGAGVEEYNDAERL